MTPDPSGAARAPQTTLDEVREALAEYGRALLYWDDLPGRCTEDEAHAISTHIKKHAPRWLGALVQAVEDLTRERDLAITHDRQPYPTAWAYEQACAALHEREAEVAQLRADGQRLNGYRCTHGVPTACVECFQEREHQLGRGE